MPDQTWKVDVEGVRHTITAERDPTTGRSMIRVDGRMATRPMTDAEDEREITIGSARYVVRRVDDSFDLDIPPEVFLERNAKAASRETTSAAAGGGRRKLIFRVIGAIVAVIIVIGLIRFGRYGFAYMRVPWKPFAAADSTFKVNFAGEPVRSEEKININGDIWNFVSFVSKYKNHYYAVEYVDMHTIVTEKSAPEVLNRFFDGWMTAIGATVLEKEPISLARNPAISFTSRLPKGSGEGEEKLKADARKRGVIALRGNRIVVASTASAEADPISVDLTKFLDSFELPPPDPRSMTVVETPMAAEPLDPPVQSTAPVEEAKYQATIAKPVIRVYAHNRTGTYYPEKCPGRPADAFPMARSLALAQGYKLAPGCRE